MLENPLMTDRPGLGASQPAADLFRAPLFTQQPFDQVPGFRGNAPAGFALPTSQGQPVSLPEPIAPQPTIPSHFTADHGFMDQQSSSKDAPCSTRAESDSVGPG